MKKLPLQMLATYAALFIGGVLSPLLTVVFTERHVDGWLLSAMGLAAVIAGWLISKPYRETLHNRQRIKLYGWVVWGAFLTTILFYLGLLGVARVQQGEIHDPEGMIILLAYLLMMAFPANVGVGMVLAEVMLFKTRS